LRIKGNPLSFRGSMRGKGGRWFYSLATLNSAFMELRRCGLIEQVGGGGICLGVVSSLAILQPASTLPQAAQKAANDNISPKSAFSATIK